ncbi:hypothetical protein QTH90_04745 [Variovorax sp. J2P1-59]|uniref:hypothetical protein n=1 Tax=Variovorax flavidus TaxID=3053501 RepID=UPI00257728C4|nr:hypothetical protein [Variovorax sp. J2P1-59]MDM0073674.1 hypothetical protein [Variovorax sp. J2P1-59]
MPARTSYQGLTSALKGHWSKPAGASATKAEGAGAGAGPSKGLWISVAGLIAALVIGSAGWVVAGAGGWYLYTVGSAQLNPPPSDGASKEAAQAEDVHAAPEVAAEAPPVAPAIVEAPAPVPPGTDREAGGPARVPAAAAVARAAAPVAPPHVQFQPPGANETMAAPPPVVEAPKPKPVPAEPRAACSAMNFIAAAQCMARQCVKPEFKAHPQCEAVRRQQRLEEEKRNPVAP